MFSFVRYNDLYNPINLDLLREYNNALDEALEEAYQAALLNSCEHLVSKSAKSGHRRKSVTNGKKSASA